MMRGVCASLALNSLYSLIKVDYKVMRLDEMGGENQDNIKQFLRTSTTGSYGKKGSAGERAEIATDKIGCNIYEEFSSNLRRDDTKIPVLFFRDLTLNQRDLIENLKFNDIDLANYSALAMRPNGHSGGGFPRRDFVIFAETEVKARELFREKCEMLRQLKSDVAFGETFLLNCVDAEGVIRSVDYVPGLVVKNCKTKSEMRKIESIANDFITKRQGRIAKGELRDNGDVVLNVEVEWALASARDFDHVRNLMLNCVYNRLAEEYEVVMLDDRGGVSQNIDEKFLADSLDQTMRKSESNAQIK